jgi:D-3-phosphoglycerate dehydrogenase / 2-oxoglutarate reductase
MPDILISENLNGLAIDALESKFEVRRLPDLWKDPAALSAQIKDCRALIVRNQTRVTSELLAAASRLVVVGRAGVGLDNIDVEGAGKAGVIITYAPEQSSISVAEFAIGLMLSLARMIPRATFETKSGQWNRQSLVGSELYGKTLGIIGAGKIGYLTAKRAQSFGMKIVAYDPFINPDSVLLRELSADLVELDDMLALSDVVSCHIPVTRETRGLLDRRRLRQMKSTAFLVNTARGEIVNEKHLVEALKDGMIAGAAVDVRSCEPPLRGELEELHNVILTPHIAAFTIEAQKRVVRAVCEDVVRVLEGKRPHNAVHCPIAWESPNAS